MRVLLIDNFDSFVYNIAQYVGEAGAEPVVLRNTTALDDLEAVEADALIVSPGPGRPEDAGVSVDAILRFLGRIPILGVCLGHQAIGASLGAKIVPAPELMHGKTSTITHDGEGVFAGLDQPLQATRYHSLVVDPDSIPSELSVSARTESGVIMGIRHREAPVEGVQFHPESVMTAQGHELVRNFLALGGLGPISEQR